MPDAVAMAPQTYEATLISGGARIAGVVTDQTGAGIPNASVQAFDAGGAVIGEANADAVGRYEIEGLPEGPVRLKNRTGFGTARVSNVTPSANGSRQDVQLKSSPRPNQ